MVSFDFQGWECPKCGLWVLWSNFGICYHCGYRNIFGE